MKFTYRNEDHYYKFFGEFNLEYVNWRYKKFSDDCEVKELVGYIGSKNDKVNIFITDPKDNHLLFAYGIKEFKEFLFVDTDNFKDEITRDIHMNDSLLLMYLYHFSNRTSGGRSIVAPYFVKDINGDMNEIHTWFHKNFTDNGFELDVDYRPVQKLSIDRNIRSKKYRNSNFRKINVSINLNEFNIIYNGLKVFRSRLMNNINDRNNWGTEMKQYDEPFNLNFKMKGVENEYNVKICFSRKNRVS